MMTAQELMDAIRGAQSLGELRRLVGPSDAEHEAARSRLALLDSIDARCEWGSAAPSYAAQEARERHAKIARVQGEYESRYF